MKRYYLTPSNVLVYSVDEPELVVSAHDKMELKVSCYKVPTGGHHGFLKVRNLTPCDEDGIEIDTHENRIKGRRAR